jgi:peptidoglycan/xylan/chitin deacetylase (PgdA/CDA1 family)
VADFQSMRNTFPSSVTPSLLENLGSAPATPVPQFFDRERGGETVNGRVKRRAKIAISLAYHLVFAIPRRLGKWVGRPAPYRLIILCYHSVPLASRASFARQLDMLAARIPVVPADYNGAAAPGGQSVAITFDDALTSVLDNAIPELRARNMPATIFVPAGSMGARPAWWNIEVEDGNAYEGELVATADALRSVVSDRLHLGAHTLTHPHLSRLRLEDARCEIAGCRTHMRNIFGIDVRTFAFPYGEYNEALIALCREAGYERVFTVIPGVIDPTEKEFARGRVGVDATDGPLEFYLKMSGAYAWMVYASALKRWFGSGPSRAEDGPIRQFSHGPPPGGGQTRPQG